MEELTTGEYVRKPFTIKAARVTADNMELVAKWCGGEIRTRERGKAKFIWVEVENALNDRQKMAYIGDWVMYSGKGFKVYNDTAFEKSFDPKRAVLSQEVPSSAVELHVDLDVTKPTLLLKKGDTTYQLNLESLFFGMEQHAA